MGQEQGLGECKAGVIVKCLTKSGPLGRGRGGLGLMDKGGQACATGAGLGGTPGSGEARKEDKVSRPLAGTGLVWWGTRRGHEECRAWSV